MTDHSRAADDHLATIYEVIEEGAQPNQAQVARRLGLTRPTVSEQVRRLIGLGLITSEARALSLTHAGRIRAENVVRRHRMAERFLTDVLGVPWYLAHQEGEAFQHAITPVVEERIVAMLAGPATCPHGNPIPGTGAVMPADLVAVHTLEPGTSGVLVRLTEDIEVDTEVLRYFEEHGLLPGREITVSERSPDGTLTLRAGGSRASLGAHLADNLWVRTN